MAKIASVLFAITMVVVFVGNFKNLLYDFITFGKNYLPCSINATSEMCTSQNKAEFLFPITFPNMYLVLFTVLFISSGLFHLKEFSCLFYGVWYFLALPSGYLILLIYSIANLDDRSWGTREGSTGALQGSGFEKIKCLLLNVWQKAQSCFKLGVEKQNTVEESKQPAPSYDAATGNRLSIIKKYGYMVVVL